MADQLTFDDLPPPPPRGVDKWIDAKIDTMVSRDPRPAGRPVKMSLDEQFAGWIRSKHGQDVYRAVVARAYRLKRAGVAHYGVGAICESIRFDRTVRRGPEAWKVNNNWRSRLARLAMAEYPLLAGFFETRELKS